MDNKYIKILKYLNKDCSQKIDIAPILLEFFPSQNITNFESYSQSKQSLFVLLNNLKNEGLIEYIHPNIGGGNETNGYSWIHKVPVYASITIKGQNSLKNNTPKFLKKIIDNIWAIIVGLVVAILTAMFIS